MHLQIIKWTDYNGNDEHRVMLYYYKEGIQQVLSSGSRDGKWHDTVREMLEYHLVIDQEPHDKRGIWDIISEYQITWAEEVRAPMERSMEAIKETMVKLIQYLGTDRSEEK